MNFLSRRFQHLAGICGVAAPITGLGLVCVAVSVSPWFSWQQNDLSDLGITATPNPFNAGLVIGGLLNVIFAIGFYRWNKPGKLTRLGSLLLLLGAVALMFVGLIDENHRPWHRLIAASYFLLTPLAYFFIGSKSFGTDEQTARLGTLAAGLVALSVIIWRAALTHDQGIAVPELIASLIMGSWTLITGLKIFFEPTAHGDIP